MQITPIRELIANIRIEIFPLIMNIGIAGYYLYQGNELGKVLYWTGACILTLGLFYMRG